MRPAPVVDLAPFRLGGSDDRRRVAAALDAACRDSGFLTVTGHGIAPSVCTEVLDAFGAFFDPGAQIPAFFAYGVLAQRNPKLGKRPQAGL